MYRTLDRLERAGLIEGFAEIPQTGRPNRKVYRITRTAGRARRLAGPPAERRAAPLRDELSVKLLFLTEARVDEISRSSAAQRARLPAAPRQAHQTPPRSSSATQDQLRDEAVPGQADMRVRTDLAWLDVVEIGGRPALSAIRRGSTARRESGRMIHFETSRRPSVEGATQVEVLRDLSLHRTPAGQFCSDHGTERLGKSTVLHVTPG